MAKLTNALKLSLAKAYRDQLKNTTNDSAYYAVTAFYNDSEYKSFSGTTDSESEFFGPGTNKTFTLEDYIYYSQNSITGHKLLPGGVSRVIPRINWVHNAIYNSWKPNATNYYVLVREFVSGIARLNVYKCLYSPGTNSSTPPTGISSLPFKTSDGYWWHYMYTISNSEAIRFLTDNYMPVPERITTAESTTLTAGTTRYQQYTQQQNAIRGSVYDVNIDSDTLYKVGSAMGTRLKASPNTPIKVVGINLTTDVDSERQLFKGTLQYNNTTGKTKFTLTNPGTRYISQAKIRTDSDSNNQFFNGVTGIVAPGLGHGSDAPSELNANSVMLTVRNIPEGEFLKMAHGQYRMINLINNPIDRITNNIAEKDYYVMCKSFVIGGTDQPYKIGDKIQNVPNPTKFGRVVGISGQTVYYLNEGIDQETNSFIVGDTITVTGIANASNTKTITIVNNRDMVFASGDLVLAEWDSKPAPTLRSTDQIESMNFVIKF